MWVTVTLSSEGGTAMELKAVTEGTRTVIAKNQKKHHEKYPINRLM